MYKLLALTLLTTLTITACDAPEESSCEAAPVDGLALGDLHMAPPAGLVLDGVAFRDQGPPQGLIITAINGKPIHRAGAKAMIDACTKQIDPPQTCSISWYQPDTADPTRVLGVGCSMMASYPLWKCYVDYMTGQKAVAY